MSFQIRFETLLWFDGLEHLRILLLSDLHLKWSHQLLVNIERTIENTSPDIIAMTGDYYDTPFGANQFMTFFASLASRIAVFWIPGNHDKWHGMSWLEQMNRTPGAMAIELQDSLFLSPRGFRYHVTTWERYCDQTYSSIESKKFIVLTHNPSCVDESLLKAKSLVLAGHLHGGQIILWKNKEDYLFPGSLFYAFCGDRFELGPSTLIVSRGLGDTLPIRFRCPHEVVIIDVT